MCNSGVYHRISSTSFGSHHLNYLERMGYRVEVGDSVGKVEGYLAGSDNERVNDIHSMFKNKKVSLK